MTVGEARTARRGLGVPGRRDGASMPIAWPRSWRRRIGADHPPGGCTNLRPREVARAHNEIQRYLVEETRLGIPAIVHEESLHGLMAWDAPCFQQSIGAAATWDPDLVERSPARSVGGCWRPALAMRSRRSSTSPAIRAGDGSRRRTARILPRGCHRRRLCARPPGRRPHRRRRGHGQAHGRSRAGRGRPQPGAGSRLGRARCATSSCSRSRQRSAEPAWRA